MGLGTPPFSAKASNRFKRHVRVKPDLGELCDDLVDRHGQEGVDVGQAELLDLAQQVEADHPHTTIKLAHRALARHEALS
jgi:hypothetical protein